LKLLYLISNVFVLFTSLFKLFRFISWCRLNNIQSRSFLNIFTYLCWSLLRLSLWYNLRLGCLFLHLNWCLCSRILEWVIYLCGTGNGLTQIVACWRLYLLLRRCNGELGVHFSRFLCNVGRNGCGSCAFLSTNFWCDGRFFHIFKIFSHILHKIILRNFHVFRVNLGVNFSSW